MTLAKHWKGIVGSVLIITFNFILLHYVTGLSYGSFDWVSFAAPYGEPGSEIKSINPGAPGIQTVSFNSGNISVEIPANVLPDNARLLQYVPRNATTAPQPLPAGKAVLFFDISLFDGSGQPITTLKGPLKITIIYKDSDITGLTEDSLILQTYFQGKWVLVNVVGRDKVNNKITVQIDHLSEFSLTSGVVVYLPIVLKN